MLELSSNLIWRMMCHFMLSNDPTTKQYEVTWSSVKLSLAQKFIIFELDKIQTCKYPSNICSCQLYL